MKRINIKGPIITNDEKWIYDWFKMDSTCPRDVRDALPEDGSEVTVMINSGGGYVNVGNEIYTILRQYEGNVNVDIIEACSAASVIAIAGDTVRITPAGRIMIHNVSVHGASGDHSDMVRMSEMLKKADESICAAYELKTGKSREELLAMMDKETWMTAEEAKEMGFVDEILFQNEGSIKMVANCEALIPEHIAMAMQTNKGKLEGNNALNMEQLTDSIAEKVLAKIGTVPAENKVTNHLLTKFTF